MGHYDRIAPSIAIKNDHYHQIVTDHLDHLFCKHEDTDLLLIISIFAIYRHVLAPFICGLLLLWSG